MAPTNPSAFLQSRTDHSAQILRMMLAGMDSFVPKNATSPRGGVHPAIGNQLNVVGNSGMTVSVDTGLVYIPGSNAFQGLYAGYNATGGYSVAVPAADPTNYRRDLLVAKQSDTTYGDAQSSWDLIDVAGTLSSTAPAPLPSVPPSAIQIAILTVNPAQTAMNGGGAVTMAQTFLGTALPASIVGGAPSPGSMLDGAMWVDPSAHQLGVVLNGANRFIPTIPVVGPDYGQVVAGYKAAATQVTSNTTLQPDPQLFIPVAANAVYVVDYAVFYNTPAATGINFNFSGPPGSNFNVSAEFANPGSGTAIHGFISTSGGGVNSTIATSGTTEPLSGCGVIITGSTAGNMQFLWAQTTSSGSPCFVNACSYIRGTRIV